MMYCQPCNITPCKSLLLALLLSYLFPVAKVMVRIGTKVGVAIAALAVCGWIVFGAVDVAPPTTPNVATGVGPAPPPHMSDTLATSAAPVEVVAAIDVSRSIPSFSTPTAVNSSNRALVPLLLTHLKYHGTDLLATTMKGWVLKFFKPQGNIDLALFYDVSTISVGDLIRLLRLTPAPSWTATLDTATNTASVSTAEAAVLGNGRFLTPFDKSFEIRILPVSLPLPRYIQADPSLLNRSDWMKCGCPPYCPARRATVEYIQGTRWYSHDLFLEPLVASYTYWLKLDVDIWIFREFPINLVDTLTASGRVSAHTGKAYNGEGCSNDLDVAIRTHRGCSSMKRKDPCDAIVSSREGWWQQDDNVFYTNFVMYEVEFFLRPEVKALGLYLNEYERGFFKHRWTDQSLAHKVLGVFHGPNETAVALDWSYLRWKKKHFRPMASFWHGKSPYTRQQLARFTRL